MSLPELHFTRNLFPKRPLGERFPSPQGESILLGHRTQSGGVEKSVIYSSRCINVSCVAGSIPGREDPYGIRMSLSLNDTRGLGTLGKNSQGVSHRRRGALSVTAVSSIQWELPNAGQIRGFLSFLHTLKPIRNVKLPGLEMFAAL